MRIKNIRTKNMKAKKRVINSRHETVGFIVTKVFEDGSYRDIFRNKARIMHDIKKKRISNLKLTSNSVIRETKNKKLDTLTLKKWNEDRYNEILNKNILERDIQEKLNNWKEKSKHNVLQLQGCRQIGKTTELLKFGYNKYENLIYVDMANDVFNFKDISKSGNKEIFMIKYCIKSNLPKFDNSKNTLIIIDEIQLSVEVYNSIRQMNRNLHCDIIVTGSYLGYTLNKEFFKPAGDIEFMSMYSLSFEEFCNAFNLKNKLTNINLFGKSDKKDYEQIFEKYELYKKIGGYPSVIMTYKKNNKNIQLCLKEIHNLVEVFKRESQMYFNNNEECLIFEDIYKSVLRSMCKNKKGSGSKLLSELDKYILDSGKKALVSRKEINKAIAWLVNSDIVGVCDLYDPVSREIFNSRKLYFMDCGIAYYMYIITEGIDKSNVDGILSENFAYCEFKKICDTDDRVINTNPYFMTYNNYELDFVMVSSKKNKYGIEIKTNKGDDKSLKVIMQKNMLDYGVLAEKTQGGNSNFSSTKTITIPVFAVGARFPYGLE